MREDLPALKWSPEIDERLDLAAQKKNAKSDKIFPKPGGSAFDDVSLDTSLKAMRKQRNAVPITAEMSDEAIRFWFWAGTDTAVSIDDAIEEAKKRDLSKAPTLKQVEAAFRGLCTGGRWDIPQPATVIRLLPRLVSWDDTIRLALEHKQPYAIYAMLNILPPAKECGATAKVAKRAHERLIEFVDSRDNAGCNEVGAALQLVHHPEGVARFFAACKKGYAKRIGSNHGGSLLVQLPTAKEAYTAAKFYKIALPAARIRELIDRYGFEHTDLLVAACAKNNAELKRIMALRTPVVVPGWLGLLKKAALVDFAEHYLLNEGANAIEGLIKTVGRRGQMRDKALKLLGRIVAAGHEPLVRKLMSDEKKKIQELIEAHVFGEKEDATPELPEADWSKWMSTVVKQAPSKTPASLQSLMPSQLPKVRTADGAYRVPDVVLRALVARVAGKSGAPPAALKHAVADLHPEDAGPFAWLFFERWFVAKKPEPAKAWVISLVEHLGGELEAAQLGATLTSTRWGRMRPKAMSALKRMESRESLTALWRVSSRRAQARKLLDEVAATWNCPWEEFRDRIVPKCGLNDLHCLELDFGKRKPIAAVLPPSRIVIVDRESGDVFQKLPPRRKVDDNELYGFAREQYKALRKSLSQVAEEQIPRFETAMISDRRFTRDHWRTHLSLHAVLGPIVCTLVWKTKRDGKWVLFMPTHPDDTCIDLNYDEVQLGEEIALAHPADMSAEEKRGWAALIADSEIVQPFDQLARLAFRPGSPEAEQELARLKALKKTGYDWNQWLHQRGWRGARAKDQKFAVYVSTSGVWGGALKFDPPLPTWNWPPSGEHSITGLHFEKSAKRVATEDVPVVIFSERLRSLLK